MALWLYRLGVWLTMRFAPLADAFGSDPIEVAVRDAICEVGKDAATMTDASDLLATGKLAEIAHLAAQKLNKNLELRTVGDVKAWLREAPKS